LPAPGNQPPLAPAPPPQAKTDAPAADVTASVKGPAGSAQGPVPSAVAAASSAPAKAADATTSLTSESLDPEAQPIPAAAPAPAAPPTLTASPAPGVGVDAATAPASGPTMPHAASIRIVATPGSNAARGPIAPAANGVAAKLSDAAINQGTIAAGNSAPSSADANAPDDSALSNVPAAAGTDATAQAVAAAFAQGTSPPAPDSASADDLSTSDRDVQQGAVMLGDAAAGAAAAGAAAAAASVAAMSHAAAASTSAAATAATAASIAQALSASAGASAADKRSRSNGPDSTLSGASNDGSVGAAQLLTSNTSTDSVPTPTFKIAAGVDTAQFGQGVADRVSLMMDGNLTNAKLQVNPPALGPIEVRIALQGGHAQVWLSSHSALTRDALESSSSKLREMLGSQGFSQVSVDISQRSFQERSPQSQAYETTPSIGADAPALAQAAVSISRSASGLLDAYA
jgi:flagellar hook-length control protein FliK